MNVQRDFKNQDGQTRVEMEPQRDKGHSQDGEMHVAKEKVRNMESCDQRSKEDPRNDRISRGTA